MDRGEIDVYESMKAGLTIYSRALDESSMSARRARIRRQWEAKGQDWVIDEEFEEEEKAALATLKEARFMAGFQEFSDDEEEVESGSRGEKTTAKKVQEEDDEDTMDEVEDDQDVDDDHFVSDDQDVNDDKDFEENIGEDVSNKGGVGSGHQ